MKSFSYTVTDPLGFHARTASSFAKEAQKFESTVSVCCDGAKVNTRRLLALMQLAIKQGKTIEIEVEGPDEEACAAAMEAYLQNNL